MPTTEPYRSGWFTAELPGLEFVGYALSYVEALALEVSHGAGLEEARHNMRPYEIQEDQEAQRWFAAVASPAETLGEYGGINHATYEHSLRWIDEDKARERAASLGVQFDRLVELTKPRART